jgi:protein-S-isoprenylcysteine O-methyltransferase Ste14
MVGWSRAVTRPQVGQAGFDAATIGHAGNLADPKNRTRRDLSLLGNILVALCYALFLYSAITFWMRTGSLVSLGLVLFNTLVVACLLTRRSATAVTSSLPNWILATLVQLIPVLLRPSGSPSGRLIVVSAVGQIVGLAIMIASLGVLSRSFGIVAANRGIKTRGLYAWIRHPLYLGESVFFVSFLPSALSYRNASLVAVFILVQVVRSYQEEALLLRDERYASYQAAVPYRFIPGIFLQGHRCFAGQHADLEKGRKWGQTAEMAGSTHHVTWSERTRDGNSR